MEVMMSPQLMDLLAMTLPNLQVMFEKSLATAEPPASSRCVLNGN
jgi:hypothetical protein